MKSRYSIDITGMRFNKPTVIKGLNEYTTNNGCRGYQKWLCVCDCGKDVITNSYQLIRGVSGSCGIYGCGGSNYIEPDIIGKKFGKLTVIKLLEEKIYKQRAWLCECDCGNFKKTTTAKLSTGQSTNCGCSLIIYADRSIPAKKKEIYANYKRSALLRNLIFELSFEDLCDIIKSTCLYCGSDPKNIKLSNTEYRTPGKYIYNGIDRFNNTIGYVKDNCVPCCFTCNSAKGNSNIEEFLEYLNRLKVVYEQKH
jgi:hypothetical protein